MTDKAQRIRNEVGQLTHNLQCMIEQRKEMHSDLIGQRQDMQQALAALEAGSVRDAMAILRDGLARRERTREQRKVRV